MGNHLARLALAVGWMSLLATSCGPAPGSPDAGTPDGGGEGDAPSFDALPDDAFLDAGGLEDVGPGRTRIVGAVEKGPFVLGSSVVVSAIDEMGNPTGDVYFTSTRDDLGRFSLVVDWIGPVSIEATGYYYNEATGELSTSFLTLRAFAEVLGEGDQEIFVNILTHLAYERVRTLAEGGMDLRNAVALADREIRWGMDIGPERYEPGAVASGLQILGTDDAPSAYLLAVAATLTQAAVIRTEERGGSIDANLQEIINRLQLDLASDGEIDEALRLEIDRAEEAVVAEEVTEALVERIRLVGSTTVIPDIDRGLDSDNDGIANLDDTCPLIANRDQNPVAGVCRVRVASEPMPVPDSSFYRSASGDFDGDGDVDLWLGFGGGASLGLNDGTGELTFGPPLTYIPGGAPLSVVDFDGDGDLDVVTGPQVLANDGTGALDAAIDFVPDVLPRGTPLGTSPTGDPAFFNGFSSLSLADLDGDGYVDAFGMAERYHAGYSWVLAVSWGASGGFAAPEILIADVDPAAGIGPVAPMDLDADGTAELVYYEPRVGGGSALPGDLHVLTQTSPRQFDETGPSRSVAPGFLASMAVGDFDDDGLDDLAFRAPEFLGGAARHSLVVLHGDGGGGFERELRLPVGPFAGDFVVLAQDGADFVATVATDAMIGLGWTGLLRIVSERDGALVASRPMARVSHLALAAGDFDGSGGDDVLVSLLPPTVPAHVAQVVFVNPADPCRTAADGDSCGDGRICLYEACVGTRCGDRFVDPAAYEECDDGNTVPGDGCEAACVFTCTSDAGCNPGDPCAGMASCVVATHECVPAGAPLAAGTPCSTNGVPTGVCSGGTTSACTPMGCGNGVVETGEDCDDRRDGDDADGCTDVCRFTCASHRECDDGDACTGAESCDLATHRCLAGTALTCTPSDPCHTATCDAVSGCVLALIDSDGDLHAAASLGACGTDCNDLRADVFAGAEELCDGIDNNCIGGIDEIAPTWFADCDRDGYAASVAGAVTSCVAPASNPGCPAGSGVPWTLRRPAGTGSTDCNDGTAAVLPGAVELAGDEIDQNCDGAESCYADSDRDGYRGSAVVASSNTSCRDTGEAPSTLPSGDCRDDIASIHPGISEIAGDEIDQNCDLAETCYVDADDDGYRTTSTVASANLSCRESREALAADPAGDCDDTRRLVHPGAGESVGDEVDANCDGGEYCCADEDHDGWASSWDWLWSVDIDCDDWREAVCCQYPPRDGWPASCSWLGQVDCYDGDYDVHPHAEEHVGAPDENCDGRELCFIDADGDGLRGTTAVWSDDTDCNDAGEASPTAGADCCDDDSRARAGQVNSYTTANACGSYDYDCDGAGTPLITAPFACTRITGASACRATSGWTSTVPGCGASGSYLIAGPGGEGCQYLLGSCLPIPAYVSTTYAQRCR